MRACVFPVSISIHLIQLEKKTLEWLKNVQLLTDRNAVTELNDQRIIRFSAYLFPEMDSNKLEKVMKFFSCLFLLDDRLDQITPEEGLDWINLLLLEEMDKCLHPLLGQIHNLKDEILELGTNQMWRQGWEENWAFHLDGLLWELNNKSKEKVPDLRDYQIQRPFASGVFLAIHLLRRETFEDSLVVQKLEWDVSRLIVLSNDLGSSDKEKSLGDFHNELLILETIIGSKKAKIRVKNEISRLCSQIIQIGDRVKLEHPKMEKWLESIMLLVGGCHYWSEITARYFTQINEELKK